MYRRSSLVHASIFMFALTVMATRPAAAQLIVGQDGGSTSGGEEEFVYFLDISQSPAVSTPLFRPQDFGLLGGPDGMAIDVANRTMYFCDASGSSRSDLYSVHFDDLQFNFSGQLRIRHLAGIRNNSSGSFQLFNALAWDPVNNRLIGSDTVHSTSGLGEEGFWVIDTTTGVASPLYLMSSTERTNYDFRGLDYNPADGLFYAVDESTSGSFSGLCSIDLNGTNAIVNVAAYPPGISDVDGVAVGDDKAYYIKGDPGDIGVRNLGTTNPPAGDEPNIIWNSWGTGRDNSSGGWAPDALVHPAGSNLAAKITSTTDVANDVELGSTIDYTVEFSNFGPSAATNVTYTITLGGDATGTISGIFSTSGLATESPTGTITATLPSAGVGGADFVTFSVTTTGNGTLTVDASIPPGGNTDGYLANNDESISHKIRTFPPVELVFTTVQSSPASDVPGGMGLKFEFSSSNTTQKFRKPYGGAHSNVVALWADSDESTGDFDELFMVKDSGGAWKPAVQEEVTSYSLCDRIDSMILNPAISVNDSGEFAIANDTTAASNADETILFFDGTNLSVVAQEGKPIPAFGGSVNYGTTMDSPAIDSLGRVAFRVASIPSPVPSGQNSVLCADNGERILAQKGITVPGGQAGGATETWENFDSDTLYIDCVGVSWLVRGDLTGSSTGDDVLAVNGEVVLQQGQGVTGLTGTLPEPSTTAGVISAFMVADGTWYARGTTSDTNQDFVVRGVGSSYTLLAKHSDPIFTGSSENWSDVDGYSPTYFGVAANSRGDYIIVGRSDNSDVSRNAVAVLNGTTELFRENDPVDLDLNGFFDDDAYIHNFDINIIDWMTLSDLGEFHCVVNLRDAAGAFIGKALLKIDITPTASTSNADIYVAKSVQDTFLGSVGQQTAFTIQVCNYGPLTATNVNLTDSLPAGLDFVSATNGASETAPGSNVVAATIPALGSCDCRTYDIVVEASAEGVLVNTASAFANETDPDSGNNTAMATVTVQNLADVSVSIADNGGAPAGQNFVYTVTVDNAGPATATNVQMTVNLDASLNFVSATNGAVEGPTGVVTRTFPSISPGGSATVQITVAGTVDALVTTTASAFANETDPNGGDNSTFLDTPVANLSDIAVSLNNTGLQVTGASFVYTLTVYNDGPATATAVQVNATLDAGLNVVSLTNGAVENPLGSGNIEATFASIPSQGSEVILITAFAPAAGAYNATASAVAFEGDPDGLNNNAALSTQVGPYRQLRAIYTRIAGDPTSVVPGLTDADDQPTFGQFDSMININVSEDGSRWTLDGSSDFSDSNLDSVMMLGSGFTGTVFAQEGKPAPGIDPCFTMTFFDDEVGFDSNNDFVWGVSTSGSPQLIYKNISGVNSVVAQTGDPVFGLVDPNGAGDEALLNSDVSQHLLDDGTVRWTAGNISNIHSAYRPANVEWSPFSGSITAVMQSSVTIVGGETLRSFPIDRGFFTTPDGLHTLVRSTVGPDTLTDVDILVYDGNAVLRNGDVIPSSAITIDAIIDAQMVSSGDWIARGDDPANDDWVVRNGVLVAATGQSLVGGAETWGDAIGTARLNNMGDYLVGGNTSEPDTNFDNVLVLNGTDIVAREGDPIDLDGNGQFDDNVFIGTFVANEARLSDDRRVHFLANLRNAEGTNLLTAFIVVDVAAGCATVQGDASGNGIRNGVDVADFVECILTGGTPTGGCACVDYDADQDVDFDDLNAFATQLVTDP